MNRITDIYTLQIYIANNCPSVTVRKALTEHGGTFMHLGSFRPAPGSSRPGFVSRITTRFGQHHYVAVTVYDLDRYNCYTPDHVDWSTWDGGTLNKLHAGDTPEKFRVFKEVGRIDNLVEREDDNVK